MTEEEEQIQLDLIFLLGGTLFFAALMGWFTALVYIISFIFFWWLREFAKEE